MKTCLGCWNRGICKAFHGIRETQETPGYDNKKFLKKMRSTTFLFDNEGEIYETLAKTCKRFSDVLKSEGD